MSGQLLPNHSIETLENGTLDVDAFDHESHVYVAWLYLTRYGKSSACRRFCSALRRLTIQIGVPNKYHETISRFFLDVIDDRRKQLPHSSWFEFRDQNPDLFSRNDNVLKQSYSNELLASAAARRSYLPPDKLDIAS